MPSDNGNEENSTTAERAQQFDTLMPLLLAMVEEFRELSKKKPDGVLSKRKVEIVNRLLADVLSLLDKEPTRRYLDLLDEDDLPQNSDVVLMLTQVRAAMNAFRDRFFISPDFGSLEEGYWNIE